MGTGLELDALHRDSTLIPVEISLSPLDFSGRHLVIAAIRDARAQRRLQRALIDERNRAQSVITNLPEGVLEFDDQEHRYVTVNPRFCEMVGYSEAEVLAMSSTPPWWHPAEIDPIMALCREVANGEIVHCEIQLLHRGGRRSPVMVTASRGSIEGRPTLLGLFHDLTAERRTALELDSARSQLAVLEDRDRIARDLHDGVIQRLFAAGLHLQSSIGRPDQDTRLTAVIEDIDEAIKEIRTTIFTLHGRRTVDSDLETAMQAVVAEVGRVLGHKPTLDIVGPLSAVSAEVGGELLAVVRELLTNVAKHARAHQTRVRLEVDQTEVTLVLEDDGVGFDPPGSSGGSGLQNLYERAERLGGFASIVRREPTGTLVRWSAPHISHGG